MGRMKFVLTVMLLGFVCVPASIRAEGPLPVIKGIRVIISGDALGVEISADKELVYTCSKMPQLLRVVIDFPRTEPGRPDTLFRVKSALISTIKVEKKTINDVMVTRVAVNLAEDADFTVQADPSDKGKMTVYFRRAAPGSSAGTAAAPPAGAGAEEQPAVEKLPAPTVPASKAMSKPVVPGTTPSITVRDVIFNADAIEIRTGGAISEFRAFTLRQPGRLVIDIPAAQSTIRSIAVPANRFGVSTARIGHFEGKLRLVFDTGEKPFPGYEVVKTDTGLRVVLNASAATRK